MKQNKHIIIVTGGIATGKSTLIHYLINRHYAVIDADKIVHHLYLKGESVYLDMIRLLGTCILDEANNIDRNKLRPIVFNNDKLRSQINALVHFNVIQEINRQISRIHDNIVFVDIPLMLEEKDHLIQYGLQYDEIWLVYATREQQIFRLMKRDQRTLEEAQTILESQMSIDDKIDLVDTVFYNTSTVQDFHHQIHTKINEIHFRRKE